VDLTEHLGMFLDESRENLQALNASLLDLERDGTDREALGTLFRAAHSLKGMSAAMGFDGMAALAHRMEEVLSAVRDGGAPVTPALVEALFAGLDALGVMIEDVAEGGGAATDTLGDDQRVLEALAEAARRVSEVADVGEEAVVAPAAEEPEAPALAEVAATLAPPAEAPAAERPGRVRRAKAAATVRVGTDRLDALMNLMGEVVIQRTRLARLAARHDVPELRETVEEVTRVTNELRMLVMQVRMMPVESVFMRFPRMVRDLAQSLGKRLELVISGEDTELDRAVIDELGDPLVHMLRNAVDHGLETPEEREAAGKPQVGTLRLSARHEGSSVVIEVEEDGRGLDPARLREVAVAKGLMGPEEAAALGDREARELIFVPGFSTAARTTDVSGRGVGLDAVRSKIAGLSGSVEIDSTPGVGSRFTIRLPLTPAITQALLVRAEGQTYALPLEAVEETVVVSPAEVRSVNGSDCVVIREAVVPLARLSERLALGGGDDSGQGPLSVVVIRAGGCRLGVVVDRLVGQQDVVNTHLSPCLGDVAGVSGATILGDGEVALIVDLAALGLDA
jgi:two-component system, chemotaxis family, sensor kinase CheA